MNYNFVAFSILSIVSFIGSAQYNDSITIKIGDRAPSLGSAEWMKGNPVKEFQANQVYVVEFGYINCDACRSVIPFLSHLNTKYRGEITLISVFKGESKKRLNNYLLNNKDKINYSVARDPAPELLLDKSWMIASGRRSWPTAFVVDKEGIIVWVGSPFFLESVILDVLGNQFEPEIVAQKELERDSLFNSIGKAVREKDFQVALNITEKLILEYPLFPSYKLIKFDVLLKSDENRAYAYAHELVSGLGKDDEPLLLSMANKIINTDRSRGSDSIKTMNNPDYGLAIDLLNRAIELSKDDLRIALALQQKAQALDAIGQTSMAIKVIEMAIEIVNDSDHLLLETKTVIKPFLNNDFEAYGKKVN